MKYPRTLFRIALIEPEIPQNTGNIGRMCVGSWSELHLVGQLGFRIDDRQLKRAGLDYWPNLIWHQHPTFESWWESVENKDRVHFFSTKASQSLLDLKFQEGDWLVFGKETKGLDPQVLAAHPKQCFKIPMPGPIRSFNLANAVAMALGQGLGQLL